MNEFFCIIYTNFIPNLPNFLKNFLKYFQNFNKFFQNIPLIFFSKFQQILSKSNTFSKFSCIFWTVSQFLLVFYQFFYKFLNSKIYSEVEICPNFYSGLLKNFVAGFRSVFKFFLVFTLFFSQNELSVISPVLIFLYCAS